MNETRLVENRLFYVTWGVAFIVALGAMLLRGTFGDSVFLIPIVGGVVLGLGAALFLAFRKNAAPELTAVKTVIFPTSLAEGSVMLQTQLEVMKLHTRAVSYGRIQPGYLQRDFQIIASVRVVKRLGISDQPVGGSLLVPIRSSNQQFA